MPTDAPSGGAGPLSVRLRMALVPDAAVAGLMVIELRVADDGRGVTVTVVAWLAPPYPALTGTTVEVETVPACTPKLILLWPEGIGQADGSGKVVLSPLDRLTWAPPTGAGPLRVTVSTALARDNIVAESKAMELKVTVDAGGVTVSVVTCVVPP
jgi:hypothetical protein